MDQQEAFHCIWYCDDFY